MSYVILLTPYRVSWSIYQIIPQLQLDLEVLSLIQKHQKIIYMVTIGNISKY